MMDREVRGGVAGAEDGIKEWSRIRPEELQVAQEYHYVAREVVLAPVARVAVLAPVARVAGRIFRQVLRPALGLVRESRLDW